MENNEKKENFSQENGNLETVSRGKAAVAELVREEAGQAVELAPDKIDVKKGGNIVIGTLNVVIRPVKKHLKSRHEKFYKGSKFHLIADIILAAAVIALLGVLFFLRGFEPKIDIGVSAILLSDKAQSGESATFVIEYKNKDRRPAKGAALTVVLPKNFVLASTSPEDGFNPNTNTFSFGDLEAGANGKVKISGLVLGEVGSQQVISYSFNYVEQGQPQNKLGSLSYPIESSAVSATLSLPSEIYQNVDFAGKLTVKNGGSNDLDQPLEFSFAGNPVELKSISSDKAFLNNNLIVLNGLGAGETVVIDFVATTAEGDGQLAVSLTSRLFLDGQRLIQQTAKKNARVIVPKFSAVLFGDKKVIKGEEAVVFRLSFLNKENQDIKNAIIDLSPAESAVAIKSLTLTDKNVSYKVNGSAISLGDLKAGAEGSLSFAVVFNRKSVTIGQTAVLSALVSYQAADGRREYRAYAPEIRFLSDLQVSSKGLYYSAQGDQLGIGPLPPAVDVPTRYWIFWQASNKGNDLKDLSVSADLPANVVWTGEKTLTAGDLRYGEIGRRVVWSVSELSKEGADYQAGFEVELVPVRADIGRTPAILANVQYSATDAFAGQEISGRLDDVSTALKDDPLAAGKGKVVQMKIVK